MLKKYIRFIIALYLSWLLFFILQKPMFIAYHHDLAQGITGNDWIAIILNGLKLDTSIGGYLTIIPLLLGLVGIAYRSTPLFKKILTIYFLFASFLIAAIFCIDVELYNYWQFRLDTTVLFYMQSPANAMASIPLTLFIRQTVLTLIYTAIMYIFLKKLILPLFPTGNIPGIRSKIAGEGCWILIGGLLFIGIRGGITTSTTNIGKVYYSSNQFFNHCAINPCFSLLASVSKSEDFASQFNFYPEEEREKAFTQLFPSHSSTVNDTTRLLTTKRPNILVILLESFSANTIEPLGGTPNVTPNFNRLSQEGIFFTNCYASSFRTDRGMVAALSGYPGQPTTSIMKMPAKSRTLPSIAKTLSTAGYTSDVLYGGDINFTNMRSYLMSTGYSKITSDVDFPISQRLSKWGAQDDVTFNYLYNEFKKRNNQTTPWHTMYLTLSTHDPFEVPYHKLEHPYLNTMAYSDSCLGHFIDQLKQEPVWKDLLIIMIADHGYRYPDTFKEYEPKRYHIPMLWLGGAVKKPCQINYLVSQTDIVSTLLGQMDLPHDEFTFSRDVFQPEYKKYPFIFYTYNNGFAVIDSTGASVYDNVGQQTLYQIPQSGNKERLQKGEVILQTLYDDLGRR